MLFHQRLHAATHMKLFFKCTIEGKVAVESNPQNHSDKIFIYQEPFYSFDSIKIYLLNRFERICRYSMTIYIIFF